MDTIDLRSLNSQLAEDLGYLEEHCRSQAGLETEACRLRLAAALTRNCIGPYLNEQPPVPLHIAVVGGAGTGKSTIVNFLTGSTMAEANPQAGFTRHPIAYVAADSVVFWPAQPGFLGPLQRQTDPTPANRDEDVYQVRRVADSPQSPAGGSVATAAVPKGLQLLDRLVVWDCPDMTTWAATGYVSRLLEVAGLADILVYVASDERYNDEVPTQFLNLLVRAGKPVIVVLTKMREADAAAFVAHFQQEVLDKIRRAMPNAMTAVLAIPFLRAEELADPVNKASKFRIPLLNQVVVLAEPALTARKRAVHAAMNYLRANVEGLIQFARRDVEAISAWRDVVRQGQEAFIDRYKREFLTARRFDRFDAAFARLMDLLELPGGGKAVSSALWILRFPYRALKGLLGRVLARPDVVEIPEEQVLRGAFRDWLTALHSQALQRSGTHALWKHVAEGFANNALPNQAEEVYLSGGKDFHGKLDQLVEESAHGLHGELEQNQAGLGLLRGGKLVLDGAGVGLALWLSGFTWYAFVAVPLGASASHQVVEWMTRSVVDSKRERVRQRQQSLMIQCLAGPLAERIAAWPLTGGSVFERLQVALKRLPDNLNKLEAAVRTREHSERPRPS